MIDTFKKFGFQTTDTKDLLTDALLQRVEFEKFRFLVRFLYPALYAQIAVAVLVAWYLYGSMPNWLFYCWIMLFVATAGSGVFIGELFKKDLKRGVIEQTYPRFTNLSAGFCFACAAFWSLTAVSQISKPLSHQVIMVLILLGQTAGSVIALAPNLKLFYAGVPMSLLPISIAFLSMGNPVHMILGVLSLVFLVAMTYFGHVVHDLITQSITLRFHNDDLLDALTSEKEKAEDASKAKSTFIASASHDLRQPIHALTLYVSVLDSETSISKLRVLSDRIKYTLRSLQSLLDGLLDISKLDAGIYQPQKEDFEIARFLDRFKAEFNTLAANKGLKIVWPQHNACVHSDPLLLEQIIRNLIGNAVKYTEHGHVEVSFEVDDDQVRIDVTDTGVGIPLENQKHIFREFYQVGQSSDKERGMGLGLSIAKRISLLLDHRIEFESIEGEGSSFSIYLDQGNTSNVDAIEMAPDVATDNGVMSAINLLIVDDEIEILSATQHLLESWGINVVTATSLHDAKHKVETTGFNPDGLITDYRLSNSDDTLETGVQVIEHFRSHFDNQNLPAVVITGDVAVDKLQAFASGTYHLLHKPVKPAALRAFILSISQAD